MRFIPVLMLLLWSLNGCSVDYAVNSVNRQTQHLAQANEDCSTDNDCDADLKCTALLLDNCQDDINCKLFRSRGELTAKCRKLCDINQMPTSCPLAQRCVFDNNLNSGICLGGVCNQDLDCGKNNDLVNKCLDKENGLYSGFCAVSCNPLNCTDNKCKDCPESLGACEILGESSAFICVPGGNAKSFDTCNQDELFCKPGHFCFEEKCLPFCNIKNEPTTCPSNTVCWPFFADSEFGFCRFIYRQSEETTHQ